MLYPGNIPDSQEILNVINRATNSTLSPTLFYHANWYQTNYYSRTATEAFHYENKFPNKHIKITKQDRLAAAEYCNRNSIQHYPDAHVLDEFYHWADDFNLFSHSVASQDKEAIKQLILPRIKHPIIIFSMITQWYIQEYKELFGEKETKLLLRESYARWVLAVDICYPKRKWNNVFNSTTDLSESNFWPQESLRAVIERINRQRNQPPRPFLRGYNERATDFFTFNYGKTPAYNIALGVELELENLQPEDSQILTDTLGDHAIFKRDGSLTNGVEICTAPATLDIHKDKFLEFFKKNKNLKAETTCGLHVHVDRKKMFKTQIPKIDMFLNKAENNPLIEKIAGRMANNYCRATGKDWATSILTKNSNRYARLNLIPEHTIEFRLFASTVDYKQFCRCLEFVQALVDYTKPGEHDCSIKEVIDQNNFLKYVKKNHHFYPTLHKFIEETL